MICPKCKNIISDNAKFCRHCGNKIPQGNWENPTNSFPGSERENPRKIHYCKNCGRQIYGDGTICDDCLNGESLDAAVKKKSVWPMILLGGVLIFFLAAGIFLGYSYVNKLFFFTEDTHKEQQEEKKVDEEEETEDDDVSISIADNNDEESENESEKTDNVSVSTTEDEVLQTAKIYSGNVVSFNGHAYAIFNIKTEGLSSFSACEQFCENMGGHLASINSAEENEFLYKFVQDSGLVLAFFGYTDQDSEGHWKWVDGSHSTYTNWANGQPNNGAKNKNADAENYAEFFKDTADGTWNDAIFGMNTYRFICEWE